MSRTSRSVAFPLVGAGGEGTPELVRGRLEDPTSRERPAGGADITSLDTGSLDKVMLNGTDIPTGIGNATAMAGDVVLGDANTGAGAEGIKWKMDLRKYKSGELYGRPSRSCGSAAEELSDL